MMLYKIVKDMDPIRFKSIVLSLTNLGVIGERIKKHNIQVLSLGISKKGIPGLSAVFGLFKIMRKFKPDIVQGWMYHGNLAVWITRLFFFKNTTFFWNIRQSLDDFTREKKRTRLIIKLGGWLSFGINGIIYNSIVGLKQHTQLGYGKRKSILIPNGFDVSVFKPADRFNHCVRKEFGLHNDELIIGLIARYHPVKGHEVFLKAAVHIVDKFKNVRFLMAGTGIDWNNESLKKLILSYKLEDQVVLLGEQSDIKDVMCCLDLLVSSSHAEAFPNVIGEAMACGVPCVVTDAGDSALIIEDTGMVVPRNNTRALASSVVNFLSLSKKDQKKMGTLSRQRIIDHFSMSKIINQYENVYERTI